MYSYLQKNNVKYVAACVLKPGESKKSFMPLTETHMIKERTFIFTQYSSKSLIISSSEMMTLMKSLSLRIIMPFSMNK